MPWEGLEISDVTLNRTYLKTIDLDRYIVGPKLEFRHLRKSDSSNVGYYVWSITINKGPLEEISINDLFQIITIKNCIQQGASQPWFNGYFRLKVKTAA
jgi:hypothetical protein